jgi:acyl-CoA synthetase (AMP-forming)/AMP-acid ligase II
MNFAQFLELHARGDPDAVALVDRRLRLSWGALDALTNRFANGLVARGVGVGDRVAIWLPNRAESVIALLGAMKLGAIPVPMNWRLQATDVGRLLAHCAPSVVVTRRLSSNFPDPVNTPFVSASFRRNSPPRSRMLRIFPKRLSSTWSCRLTTTVMFELYDCIYACMKCMYGLLVCIYSGCM